MSGLVVIDAKVAGRCEATVAAVQDWPCRAGCADCCRSLAHLPALTAAEWGRLEAAVPVSQQGTVRQRIREQLARSQGPYTCPWLDPERDHCLVYEARPVACRTYGFYVERDKGLYCSRIERRAAAGELDQVVWGNQVVVDEELDAMGPRIPLAERVR
jgi:Fe-S-cluster containining protein